MGRLEGKVALVTGGAKGQGEAISKIFAKEGATVIISDISEEGEEISNQINNNGGKAHFIPLDVSKSDQWTSIIDFIDDNYNRLDILVNNAGIPGAQNIETLLEDEWQTIIDVNAKSVFLGMKTAVNLMKRNSGGGSIINNSSIWGLVGSGRSAGYQGAKGAVTLLTKTAAIEFSKYNIRVNSIHPGIILTPMVKDSIESGRGQLLIDNTPLKRPGTPDEVAHAVLFLAADESSYITGVALPIDGGYTAG
ncbi:SDR family NAD(P)-dependent oxidoreductase [Planococcus salinus]|uniref:Glucose 1-dehydrogenase n=1 Tax=Planococcus salinus TaxID=1848460 RepID=A0A3M8P8P9_9BACL|nr:glucose 1-dehydrogenase [Planococcus salinus]RNF39801.1 glucose 1-dehydrogenase [Planococcus salinus]